MQHVDFSLADLHAAAERAVEATEATLAMERASGSDWQAAYIADQKARAARAVAAAIAEVAAEL